MKTLKKIGNKIDQLLTQWSLNYIEKVSKTLYPKPYLDENEDNDHEDDDTHLFI